MCQLAALMLGAWSLSFMRMLFLRYDYSLLSSLLLDLFISSLFYVASCDTSRTLGFHLRFPYFHNHCRALVRKLHNKFAALPPLPKHLNDCFI
jgi:hypothetical protein